MINIWTLKFKKKTLIPSKKIFTKAKNHLKKIMKTKIFQKTLKTEKLFRFKQRIC